MERPALPVVPQEGMHVVPVAALLWLLWLGRQLGF